MTKKWLAALIAVSMLGFAACSDDDGDDSSSDKCTTGQMQCSGNTPQVCINGVWTSSDACANGQTCNNTTGRCEGGSSSGGDNGGNTGGNNGGNGGNNGGNEGGNTGTLPTVGASCDRNTFTQICTNGGANALVCWDDVVTEWSCAEKCVDAGYDSSKPLQVNCKKADSGSSSGETCDQTTYAKGCTSELAGSYCGNKGTVVNVKCTADDPCVDNGGYIACKSQQKNNTPSTGVACTPESTGQCDVACNADKTEGYYWDTTRDVVGTKKCPNADCTVSGTSVGCASGSTGGSSETCDVETYVNTCADDKATAKVCVKGTVKNWTCYNNICEVDDENQVNCPKDASDAADCTGDTVTEGGVENQCCNPDEYKPAGCDTATNSGLRCSSKGKVTKWTCSTGTCKYDATSTEYPGGKYTCE